MMLGDGGLEAKPGARTIGPIALPEEGSNRFNPARNRPRAPRSKRDLGQGGFTLLEVLVALIIFSIAFGAIASIFQTSLRQSTTAETLMNATAVAERQIERYGTELPLALGETSGLSPEGLNWKARIELGSPPRDNSEVAIYRITVDVGPENGGQSYLTLETLRIGRAP